MTAHLMNCPHCRARKWMDPSAEAHVSMKISYLLAVCQNCNGPVVLLVEADRPKPDYRWAHQLLCADRTIDECGWRVRDYWPKPSFNRGLTPPGVPESIGTVLEHSHEAAEKGGYDLAIIGYQRVLRMAQKALSPDFGGGTRGWILNLIKHRRLTSDIKTWLSRIRLQRAVEEATAVEAEEFATFAHAVLEQIFSTRSKMARLRSFAVDC